MLETASAPRPTALATRAIPICEIRVLRTADEMIDAFRLRFQVYNALGYIQRGSRTKLEIDEYDTSSLPFGAFDLGTNTMIGTLRLVVQQPLPYFARLVRRVLGRAGDHELSRLVLGRPPHPLPSIVSADIARRIQAFNAPGFEVYELSRTIVRPDHRGVGVSRGLLEFGLAHAAHSGPAVLIGSCLPEHMPMYAKYGYRNLSQDGLDYFDSVGQIANAVVCRTDVLPPPTRHHVDELHRAFDAGARDHTLEIGRGSYALYRFDVPGSGSQRRMDW